MIAYLSGEVIELNLTSLVLNVNGVGYLINIAEGDSSLFSEGETQKFLIHTEVREDSISLYGFKTREAKECFQLLKTVKGVAAKSASEILSAISIQELVEAIERSDFVRIQKIKGIGKKTAERIVLELKDKISSLKGASSSVNSSGSKSSLNIEFENTKENDALSALIALGFSRKNSTEMLKKLESSLEEGKFSELTAGQIVSDALQYS